MIEKIPKSELSAVEGRAVKRFEKIFEIAKDTKSTAGELIPILEKRVSLIHETFWFAFRSHRGQWRKNGDLYIIHPIEVAIILVKMGFRGVSIAAGLLHDVVERSGVRQSQLNELFIPKVTELVMGVTQLTTRIKDKDEEDARNIRKLLSAALQRNASEIRIYFIKIADRLHNSRTMYAMPDDRKMTKAVENLYIYGPLAGRLGLTRASWELEDSAFSVVFPEQYNEVKEKADRMKRDFSRLIKKIERQLRPLLSRVGIKEATVDFRIKHLWSIRNKIMKQKCSFEDLRDVIAIRIIVNTVEECWKVFSVLNFHFPPMVKAWNNYIDYPKVNSYQSIHTNIAVPPKLSRAIKCIEVQIRTYDMHEVAENGTAAHWRYTHSDKEWLQRLNIDDFKLQMEEYVRHKLPAKVFREKMQIMLTQDYISVRTPRGEGIILPYGATPVDFAYKVHSGLGNHCIGAEIEGEAVPLNFPLTQEGVFVRIIKGDHISADEKWLDFIKTDLAREEIKKILKKKGRTRSISRQVPSATKTGVELQV